MNNEYNSPEILLNASMINLINYYRKHPEKFMEEILGTKLYPYQKEMLKGLYRNG